MGCGPVGEGVRFFSIECSDGSFDVALDKGVDNFIVLGGSVYGTVFEKRRGRRRHRWDRISRSDWFAVRPREVGHCQHSCVDFGDLLISDRRRNWKRRGR